MNPSSALQLIDIQVSTLFVCDADGRLWYIREPGYEESELDPAPRFFMGRTLKGNIWRFRHDLPVALLCELEQLCRIESIAVNLADQSHNATAIRAALNAHAPITIEERGPAYLIPEVISATVNVVLISEANAHFLETNFSWTLTSRSGFRIGPLTAAVVQGSAVSICHCARLTPWAAEAGVETAEAFRGQGYASAVVAGWASAVRQRGLVPLYSTSWENVASQGVARKLGMVLYGEDWSIT